MQLRLRPLRSPIVSWGAAAVTAAALYAVPLLALWTLVAPAAWNVAAIAVDLAVLAVVALRLWSPLVVLGAAVLSCVGFALYLAVTTLTGTCGHSNAAGVVEAVGALAIGLPLGAWAVRRGARVLAVVPAAWVLAGVWFAVVAHLIPGGTGSCFD